MSGRTGSPASGWRRSPSRWCSARCSCWCSPPGCGCVRRGCPRPPWRPGWWRCWGSSRSIPTPTSPVPSSPATTMTATSTRPTCPCCPPTRYPRSTGCPNRTGPACSPAWPVDRPLWTRGMRPTPAGRWRGGFCGPGRCRRTRYLARRSFSAPAADGAGPGGADAGGEATLVGYRDAERAGYRLRLDDQAGRAVAVHVGEPLTAAEEAERHRQGLRAGGGDGADEPVRPAAPGQYHAGVRVAGQQPGVVPRRGYLAQQPLGHRPRVVGGDAVRVVLQPGLEHDRLGEFGGVAVGPLGGERHRRVVHGAGEVAGERQRRVVRRRERVAARLVVDVLGAVDRLHGEHLRPGALDAAGHGTA